jgi:hypothetical protein
MISCHLITITFLCIYVINLINDYRHRRADRNLKYKAKTYPDIANETECWG